MIRRCAAALPAPLAALLLAVAPLRAEVWYVNPTAGHDAGAGTSWSAALASLTEAALRAAEGDTLALAAGDTTVEKASFGVGVHMWPVERADSLSLALSPRPFVIGNPKLGDADDLLLFTGAGAVSRLSNLVLEGDLDGSGLNTARMLVHVREGAEVRLENLRLSNAYYGAFVHGTARLNVLRSRASLINFAFRANSGGELIAEECLAEGLGVGFYAYDQGRLRLRRCAVDGTSFGLVVDRSGLVTAEGLVAHGPLLYGVRLLRGGPADSVALRDVHVFAPGTRGVQVEDGDTSHVRLVRLLVDGEGVGSDGVRQAGQGALVLERPTLVRVRTAAVLNSPGLLALRDALVAHADSGLVNHATGTLDVGPLALWQVATPETGTVSGDPDTFDPRFAAPARGDWRLRPASPAARAASDGGPLGAFGRLAAERDRWMRPAWTMPAWGRGLR